ncbi:hypothetical protein DY000_02063319 [Brassica cretica]|uniref:Uncharacterized protein n=1 Tax=Brassica cretica TaxID=69181 RepID=A0ABQ7AVJ8_BRACR|nr:hypothetical protein DY000_02063319 [Brassica cretica]
MALFWTSENKSLEQLILSYDEQTGRFVVTAETEAFDNESGGESCANGRGRRREKAYENPAHERCKILSHPKKKGRDSKLRSSQSSSSEIESEFSHHDPAFARINNGSSGSCPSSVIAAQRDWQLWFLRQPNRFFFDETAS